MTIEEMQAKRKELGFSYAMLSTISGVPVGTVQKIFGGITTSPRRGTIERLEAALTGRYKLTEEQSVYFDYPADWEGEEDTVREKAPAYNHSAASKRGADDPDLPAWIDPTRQGSYTIRDLEALPEHFRMELDDGVIVVMESPSLLHQEVLACLYSAFRDIIRKNRGACRALVAPFDLHFSEEDENNCRQPDIMVVCDRSKLGAKFCTGGPDLVIEILSPSTRNTDMTKKQYQYSEIGVREYWLVDPLKQKIVVYVYEEENMIPQVYGFENRVPIHIWPGEEIDFAEIREEVAYAYELEGKIN